MKIDFYKYQATGNDFVMLDNRNGVFDDISADTISKLCNRRFGVGADGVILVQNHEDYDFEMRYYNADGTRSFCGNGARATVRFAEELEIVEKEAHFLAIDGEHKAKINVNSIALDMSDVKEVLIDGKDYLTNTGSPHYVSFVENVNEVDIVAFGKNIRYSDKYKAAGVNVNVADLGLNMRTYERGVEDETLSCGTGATAVALAYAVKNELFGAVVLDFKVKGGQLFVSFVRTTDGFENIKLKGPAEMVFKGEYEL